MRTRIDAVPERAATARFRTQPGDQRRRPAPSLGRAALLLLLALLPCAAGAGPDGAGPAYRHMELADFKERKGDIPGSRIELAGWLVSVTGDAILFADPDDRTGIIVDLSGLKPEDRRHVRGCTRACEATVQGVAAKVRQRNGLKAERLTLR